MIGIEVDGMMTATYQRARGMVWRVTADRVLTRRSGSSAATADVELRGAVALIWLALDTPATIEEVRSRLVEAGLDVGPIEDELATLVESEIVTWIA